MNLLQLRNRAYVHARDFKREKHDPLFVDVLLNEANEEFGQQTRLHVRRVAVTTTSGVIDLVPSADTTTPDDDTTASSVRIEGEILRVEDADNSNNAIPRTTEEAMDVLYSGSGANWKSDTTGNLQFWMRGKGPNSGNATGYESILVYPLVNARNVNLFFVRRPPTMVETTDSPDGIPVHYHMALVFHAVAAMVAPFVDQPAEKGIYEYAQKRYAEYLRRALEERETALGFRL